MTTVPTPEELIASVNAEIGKIENSRASRREDIAEWQRINREDAERIAELKRMLPRKPRKKKAKTA